MQKILQNATARKTTQDKSSSSNNNKSRRKALSLSPSLPVISKWRTRAALVGNNNNNSAVCAPECASVYTQCTYICVTYEVCMYVSVYTHCKHGIYSHFGLFYSNVNLRQYARSMLSHKEDVIETVKSIFKFKKLINNKYNHEITK